jgi:ectoine hydroxylase-related dioxygenase (phytanoyl-CoA dioxygenase family)
MDRRAAEIPRIDAEAYREQGFVLVRGVFDRNTIAHMREEADAMLERVVAAGGNVEATWTGSWREQLIEKTGNGGDSVSHGRIAQMAAALSSIHDVQYHSAYFMRTIMDARLTGAAAQLIGDDVQLHHTKYHVKPPAFGAPFPMHQDYPYFPHESHTMLAAAIHIDAADVENGCLCVVPGSHRMGPLPHRTDGSHFLPLDEWPLDRAIPCEAEPGDVLFLNYLTVHGSYVNRSPRPRRLLLVQMRSPLDRPTVKTHLSPGQGTMLRGTNPRGLTDWD